jgi:hypothetical protein
MDAGEEWPTEHPGLLRAAKIVLLAGHSSPMGSVTEFIDLGT